MNLSGWLCARLFLEGIASVKQLWQRQCKHGHIFSETAFFVQQTDRWYTSRLPPVPLLPITQTSPPFASYVDQVPFLSSFVRVLSVRELLEKGSFHWKRAHVFVLPSWNKRSVLTILCGSILFRSNVFEICFEPSLFRATIRAFRARRTALLCLSLRTQSMHNFYTLVRRYARRKVRKRTVKKKEQNRTWRWKSLNSLSLRSFYYYYYGQGGAFR